ILDLYDPDRSQNVMHDGAVATYEDFVAAAHDLWENEKATGGAGIRILTETITSPTLADQLAGFLKQYPSAKWVQYEPAGGENARAGSIQAFGQYGNTIYHFDKAD